MPLKELHRSLGQGLRAAYVVVGEATPLVEAARDAIVAATVPQLGPAAFNHGRFRAGESGAAAISAARTLPMMAAVRLVEVRDLHEGSDEFFQALVEYLQDPSPSTVLCAFGSSFPKVERGGSNWAVRVKNALKERGLLVTFTAQSIPPARFVVEAALRRGKAISNLDAERLVDAVGADLALLDQEVEKLSLYVGDAPAIDGSAIAEASAALAEAVIWDLTAGLAARDPDLALGALYRLQSSGDDARKLLGMVMWQIRELLRASELVARGATDREITAEVKMRWDLLKRVRPVLASGFPSAATLLRRLATANRHMNSHRAGAERILEGVVLEMLDGRLRQPPPVPRPR
jgi:DNA polymerase III subunit delta